MSFIQHAVTEHVCPLTYEGESGALNEHVSDVFAMLATLWAEKKTSEESDWLIGEGCLVPGLKGVALRNMKFPGTAYDDPKVCSGPDTDRLRSLDPLARRRVLRFSHN